MPENQPFLWKVCTKCGKLKTINNYHKDKRKKYGVRNICKTCTSINDKKYNKKNKEKRLAYGNKYYQDNKDEVNKKKRQKYQENKEEIKAAKLKYYYDNKEKLLIQKREYAKTHKESIKKKNKKWRENNPDKCFNYDQKRRCMEEQQGKGITIEQWKEMMEYFDWKCAYSEELLTPSNRSIDHVIALDNGGENEIWNLVPMKRNYNSSKSTKDMESWYKEQDFFSEERLSKIYKWREYAKNKWNNIKE